MSATNAQLVKVDLGAQSYPIHIAPGLLGRSGELIKPHVHGKVLIIADHQVAKLHAKKLSDSLTASGIKSSMVTFPPGEESKSLGTAADLWDACATQRIDRSDAIIALGGGVSGDLAGFVAACWMRGIAFIQIPTSLLAMVDSSIGGKVGVNSTAGKNLVGAFKQPACVIIDPELVATMDKREYRAGLAEVLKYGVIRDPMFFTWQEVNADALAAGNPAAVAHAVAESCRIKAEYVAADQYENGIRAHLNYGHTFGHALERETEYAKYLHGEAVGIGMRMAAHLAAKLGVLKQADLVTRQDALLERYGLPLKHACFDVNAISERLTAACKVDKKVTSGRTRFILPVKIGEVVIHQAPSEVDVRASFAAGMSAA